MYSFMYAADFNNRRVLQLFEHFIYEYISIFLPYN